MMMMMMMTVVVCVYRYMFGRTRFLDGFEVHFLCEYTGYWHMTEDVGFWLGTPPQLQRTAPSASAGGSTSATAKRAAASSGGAGGGGGGGGASQVSVLLNLALSFVQVVHGIPEHANNCRLVAPVVATLLKSYDYLRAVDSHAQPDTYASIRYDTIRDAVLACARKPTRVSL